MSSSRSIAAARNRRSGETSIKSVQPPRRSIPSQSTFVNTPNNRNNPNNPNLQKPNFTQRSPTGNPTGNPNGNPTGNPNGLPFTKLSVSDAVGLITLRLGRVEQYIIDTQENVTQSNIPENSKIIDMSVLTSMVNRIDSLEKKEINTNYASQISYLEKEIISLKSMVSKLSDELITFINVSNEKFIDFENALVEIEKETAHHLEDAFIEEFDDELVNNENENEKENENKNENENENIQLISSEL